MGFWVKLFHGYGYGLLARYPQVYPCHCLLDIFQWQSLPTSQTKAARFSDIDYSTTVHNIYSNQSSLLERKEWTLPVLTDTFDGYFLSLLLMWQIFRNNVWWPVAKRVIARNVGSCSMSEGS